VLLPAGFSLAVRGEETSPTWQKIAPYFSPPQEYAGKFGSYRLPLLFDDGTTVKTADDWQRRRQEIINYWQKATGSWPALIDKPTIQYQESKRRENFMQHRVLVEIAAKQTAA